MNNKLMLTVLIIAGLLIAPAARADHPGGDDFAGHYCGLIDSLFGDWAIYLGCSSDKTDRAQLDKARPDKATDGSGRDVPKTSDNASDGRDAAPSNSAVRGNAGSDPRCLSCGGQSTPKDGND